METDIILYKSLLVKKELISKETRPKAKTVGRKIPKDLAIVI